jgi:hypothetical protein
MASRHSLRRVATLTKKVHDDLHKGGMGMTFRYLFRSTAILARVVSILAEHVAEEAEERARERAAQRGEGQRAEEPARARTRLKIER